MELSLISESKRTNEAERKEMRMDWIEWGCIIGLRLNNVYCLL